jgi:putative flippase GtrA
MGPDSSVGRPRQNEPAEPRRQSFAKRFLSLKAAAMLGRNTLVSCLTFLIGILLLWLLVEQGGMAKVPAVALSFLIGTSIHYVLGRTWIFKGTDRAVASGYAYFLVNAGIGLVLTTTLFAAMISWTRIHYLVARILVSVVAGLVMFLLNATLNFRRL